MAQHDRPQLHDLDRTVLRVQVQGEITRLNRKLAERSSTNMTFERGGITVGISVARMLTHEHWSIMPCVRVVHGSSSRTPCLLSDQNVSENFADATVYGS